MRDESIETHRHWSFQFLAEALNAKTDQDVLRFALASVQSAIAVFEMAQEHAKDKGKIKEIGKSRLPHLGLLRDIRAQTFHRRVMLDLILSKECEVSYSCYGPIKVGTGTSPSGSASVMLTQDGPEVKLDGGTIKQNVGGSARDISVQNGQLFDQDANQWVRLTDAIGSYLKQVPSFLEACKPFLSEGPEPR